MKKLGEYEWNQLSIWDFAPKDCIEKFIRSDDGKHVYHYYLRIVNEVVSDNHIRLKNVTSLDGVPEDVLNWKNDNYRLKIGGKAAESNKEV
jgi:hypothetical protein